jgi:hypothetical protein
VAVRDSCHAERLAELGLSELRVPARPGEAAHVHERARVGLQQAGHELVGRPGPVADREHLHAARHVSRSALPEAAAGETARVGGLPSRIEPFQPVDLAADALPHLLAQDGEADEEIIERVRHRADIYPGAWCRNETLVARTA